MRIQAPTFLTDMLIFAAALFQKFHFVAALVAFVFKYWHCCISLFKVHKGKTNAFGLQLFVPQALYKPEAICRVFSTCLSFLGLLHHLRYRTSSHPKPVRSATLRIHLREHVPR